MCDAAPTHDGTPPPPGENWCPERLRIELHRWFAWHPMTCGKPALVSLP